MNMALQSSEKLEQDSARTKFRKNQMAVVHMS